MELYKSGFPVVQEVAQWDKALNEYSSMKS